METDPEELLRRRIADKNKVRQLDLDIIRMEITGERNAAQQIAFDTKTRLYIVKNNVISEASDEIKLILRNESN